MNHPTPDKLVFYYGPPKDYNKSRLAELIRKNLDRLQQSIGQGKYNYNFVYDYLFTRDFAGFLLISLTVPL